MSSCRGCRTPCDPRNCCLELLHEGLVKLAKVSAASYPPSKVEEMTGVGNGDHDLNGVVHCWCVDGKVEQHWRLTQENCDDNLDDLQSSICLLEGMI